MKIAINGFGRIGRGVLRAFLAQPRQGLEIVALNDPTSLETLAHLLKYDSVHGTLNMDVAAEGNVLRCGELRLKVTHEADPAKLSWQGIDMVFECSGRFTERDKAELHLKAGAGKVLISAPAKGDVKTIAFGVNHQTLSAADTVISNASCTTNCLAPVAKVIDEQFGIEHGLMTTIHAYTSDQTLLDNAHKDLRRARAAGLNMVPTSTGAAKAVGLVLPELAGKLDGYAVRVPTPNVSLVDLTFVPQKAVTKEVLNNALKTAAQSELAGVLAVSELPLVSSDFNGVAASSTADLAQTQVLQAGTLAKVVAWYDNETGFANRMLDVANYIAKQ